MPFGIGPLEIIIVLVIVLLIFGPKRLPDLGRSLGRGMREFKDSVTGKDKEELPAGDANEERTEPARTTLTSELSEPVSGEQSEPVSGEQKP
jgi:sec-independent protein translocase protein TatA